MKIIKLILICTLITACTSNNKTPLVTKIDGLTKTDTTMHPYFINEFYLISPSPNSSAELKNIMKGVSSSNVHQDYDIEGFIFLKEGGTFFSSSYLKDSTRGIDSDDILGRIEYKKVNGKRKLIYVHIEK